MRKAQLEEKLNLQVQKNQQLDQEQKSEIIKMEDSLKTIVIDNNELLELQD